MALRLREGPSVISHQGDGSGPCGAQRIGEGPSGSASPASPAGLVGVTERLVGRRWGRSSRITGSIFIDPPVPRIGWALMSFRHVDVLHERIADR